MPTSYIGTATPRAGWVTARVGPKLPMAIGLPVAAVGVALLTRPQPNSSYVTLLPAMLAWGIGLGILTPAVVAGTARHPGHFVAGMRTTGLLLASLFLVAAITSSALARGDHH